MNNKIYTIIALGSLLLALGSYKETQRLEDGNKTLSDMLEVEQSLNKDLEGLEKEIAELESTAEDLRDKLESLTSENKELRTIRAKLTAYSPLDNLDGQQAMGDPTKTSIGKTPGKNIVAADPAKIPYGTILEIPDWGIVEVGDTGGALRRDNQNIRLDLYHDTYKEAMAFGVQERQVKIVRWGNE